MHADFYSANQLEPNQEFRRWCREGELNPQGAKHRWILSPTHSFSKQPPFYNLQALVESGHVDPCGLVMTC